MLGWKNTSLKAHTDLMLLASKENKRALSYLGEVPFSLRLELFCQTVLDSYIGYKNM